MLNNGHRYEVNAHNYLNSVNELLVDGRPAGNLSNRPDLMLGNGQSFSGCELKLTPKTSGSIRFCHKNNEWQFEVSPQQQSKPEVKFLVEIAKKVHVIDMVNQFWSKPPLRRTPIDKKLERKLSSMTKVDVYKSDHQSFPDIYIKDQIKPQHISWYYNSKQSYYLNVGTHGFYLLGNKDPLQLNHRLKRKGLMEIPTFESMAGGVKGRVRVQYKGHDKNHEFVFSLEFSRVTKSPYNLAAVVSKDNPEIDLTKTILPF